MKKISTVKDAFRLLEISVLYSNLFFSFICLIISLVSLGLLLKSIALFDGVAANNPAAIAIASAIISFLGIIDQLLNLSPEPYYTKILSLGTKGLLIITFIFCLIFGLAFFFGAITSIIFILGSIYLKGKLNIKKSNSFTLIAFLSIILAIFSVTSGFVFIAAFGVIIGFLGIYLNKEQFNEWYNNILNYFKSEDESAPELE